MKSWKSLKRQLLKDPQVKQGYERLKPKYTLISQMITLRQSLKWSQAELANRAGTRQSAIARFESGNVNPSLDFLERMAHALNSKLEVSFRPL